MHVKHDKRLAVSTHGHTSARSWRLRGRPRLARLGALGAQSGQAAVEFALVVPLLCLIILALVDFGKGVNYWLDANHLAQEGARRAAVLGSSPEPGGNLAQWIQQHAETSELRDGTGSVTSPATVCISIEPGPDNTSGDIEVGDPVTVTVTADYKWIPFAGGSTFAITGSSTMRLERVPPDELDGQCSS